MRKIRQRAVFGANCYWGAEAAFSKAEGVLDTNVGFMGDSLCQRNAPSSDQDAKDRNQVEVVMVDFDAEVISYGELIDVFWGCHNSSHPVYRAEDGKPSLERSVIFVADKQQRKMAEDAMAVAVAINRLDALITTAIEDVGHFHRAAEEDQRYLERNEGAVCSLKGAAE